MTNMHGEKGLSHTLGSAKSVPDVLIKNSKCLTVAGPFIIAGPTVVSVKKCKPPATWKICLRAVGEMPPIQFATLVQSAGSFVVL